MCLLVIGDVVLDKYLDGVVTDVSSEAPVPILKYRDEISYPGGAAYVACNASAFLPDVTLIGGVGDDVNGAILSNLCKNYNVNAELIIDVSSDTHCKLRVVSSAHQLARIDYGKTRLPPDFSLAKKVEDLFNNHQVAIIYDHARGLFNSKSTAEVIGFLRSKNVATIVDARDQDKFQYCNASILIRNRNEFEAWVGKVNGYDETVKKARKLIADLGLEYVLITLGADGMILVSDAGVATEIAPPQKLYDVTNAGDVVAAFLAIGLCKGMTLEEACGMANSAASVAVQSFGPRLILPSDLQNDRT